MKAADRTLNQDSCPVSDDKIAGDTLAVIFSPALCTKQQVGAGKQIMHLPVQKGQWLNWILGHPSNWASVLLVPSCLGHTGRKQHFYQASLGSCLAFRPKATKSKNSCILSLSLSP